MGTGFFEENHFEQIKQYIRRIPEYIRDIHIYQPQINTSMRYLIFVTTTNNNVSLFYLLYIYIHNFQ